MQLTVTVAGSTEHPLVDGSSITWDLNENQARAALKWNADTTFAIDHQDAVLIKEGATTRFTGRVRNFSKRKSEHSPGKFEVAADVLDHVSLMADAVINKSYVDTDDQDIIIDIISEAGLSGSITANTTNVDTIKTALSLAFNTSVREALDQIAALSGGVWYLDATAVLHYHTQANGDAGAFHFVDIPAANSLTYAEEFDNAAWTKTNCSITANSIAGPSGTTTADKLVEASDTSQIHFVSQNASGSITDNTMQTLSCFAKAAERTKVQLVARSKAGTLWGGRFDLTLGTVIGNTAGTIATISSDLGSGWYRVRLTFDSESGATVPDGRVRLLDATGVSTYNGDGSSGLYIWGIQFDNDAHDLRDYVYTQAATKTAYGLFGLSVESRFDEPCNTVNIVGGEGSFGRNVKVTRTDSASVTAYGTIEKTIEVPTVTTTGLANAWGDAYLGIHANPEMVASGSTREDGIKVGQIVRVTASDYGLLSKEFLVSRVTAKQETATKTLWTLSLGRNTLSQERLLRKFEQSGVSKVLPQTIRGVSVTGNKGFIKVQDTVSNSTVFQDASGGITISAWVRTDTAVSGYGGILTATSSSEAANDGYSFWIRSTGANRNLRFAAGSNSGSDSSLRYDYGSNFPEGDGLWHHCLVSWNGVFGASAEVAIYFDGVEDTVELNDATGTFNQVTTSDLSLGDVQDASFSLVCAWNKQFKDGDIQRLAAKPDALVPPSIFPNNRILYWRMDDFAHGVTISNAAGQIQDAWQYGFDGDTAVTVSGDFGSGEDSQRTP